MSYLVDLKMNGVNHQDIIGDKAQGLLDLHLKGQTIPDTIVLSTGFFDHLLEESGVKTKANFLLTNFFHKNISEEVMAAKCREFKEILLSHNWSTELIFCLDEAYKKACGDKKTLIVRSSVCVNDPSLGVNFDGIYDSYSCVISWQGIQQSIAKIFSRTYSLYAILHALRNNIDPRNIKLAVIIQEYVQADYVGTIHTSLSLIHI